MTAAQLDLVERIGVLHDRLGFSPAPGRVVGLLLVSPRAELTFAEIRASLGLSKSSTSAALSLLLEIGSVEYSTRPGDRKRYFRKSYRNWEGALLARIHAFLSLRELLREAHELNRANPERSGPEIPRMIEFLEFLEGALHDAYARWTAARNGAGATADPELRVRRRAPPDSHDTAGQSKE
jgi:DNA-binding transcriptional regulator GbsR (MarR family)